MKAIKYGAVWCGPCRQMEENLSAAGINYTTVDIDDNPEVCDEKGIKSIPVTEFYTDDLKLICTKVGLLTVEEIQSIGK